MMKVKIFNTIAESGLRKLEEAEIGYSADFDDYDAILVRSAKLHDIPFSKNLKCIARAGAGVNNIPIKDCSERGIVVFNTPGANANAVKELVMAALLLSSRGIYQGIEWVKGLETEDISKEVEAKKSRFAGQEIAGKKLGVIGLGAIGVQVANAAASMGMVVYGYDPFISVKAAWGLKARVHRAQSLKEIFETCDYISIHVPFNEKTVHIIDKDAIDSMKQGVRLFNFARGELVDTQAVQQALEDGKAACYVTDFPIKELLQYDEAICLPHLGASTKESEENCAVMAAEEIMEYLLYGNIVNSVNFPDMKLSQETKCRICVINKNIPNMVSSMTSALAEAGVNIENMANKARDNYAYTILETNDEVTEDLLERLRNRDGIVQVRLIIMNA